MKSIYIKILLYFFLSFFFTSATAYEVRTHEILSEAAYVASILNHDVTLYNDLGISSEDRFIGSNGKLVNITSLIKLGSASEDDLTPTPRPPNHFFNPSNGEGLIDYLYFPLPFPIFIDFFPSPSWILEDSGSIENHYLFFDQNYSYADANDYFHDALALPDLHDRKNNFGKVFETLGHVIHHIQDMAQPEHVRDDPHLLVVDPSAYEQYAADKTGEKLEESPLPVLGYPIPAFSKARDFWINDQKGLAEFTNYNFVSVDTNFSGDLNNIIPHPDFQYPNGENATINQVTGAELGVPTFTGNAAWFIETPVVDSLNNNQSGVNEFTSFYSLYDSDLETMGVNKIFSLNVFTFDSAMNFLVPRAVSYSAGLINHFFRGRLKVSSAIFDEQNIAEVIVQNVSSEGNDFINRVFEVYYDKNDGTRAEISPVNVDGNTWEPLVVNDTATLTFNYPNDVDESKDNPFVIVYKDQIGEEDGIAAITFEIVDENTPIIYHTHYLCTGGLPPYYIDPDSLNLTDSLNACINYCVDDTLNFLTRYYGSAELVSGPAMTGTNGPVPAFYGSYTQHFISFSTSAPVGRQPVETNTSCLQQDCTRSAEYCQPNGQ